MHTLPCGVSLEVSEYEPRVFTLLYSLNIWQMMMC